MRKRVWMSLMLLTLLGGAVSGCRSTAPTGVKAAAEPAESNRDSGDVYPNRD